MTRLLAFIRPRLQMAEGLLLIAITVPRHLLAMRMAAWEKSFTARVQHTAISAGVDRFTQPRSPKP